ncbi:MAG: 1-acyl-sn-glycerol-3-phosphate acyltransferase [Sulfitobacter sp.]
MTQMVEIPLWLFVTIVLFAAVTALSHFLLPSVRWFFRRRLQKAVARLNTRLTRPIEPFKLTRRYDMIQRLSYDPEVTREIVNYARLNDVPENVAFQKAQSYAREIVPSFSAFAYFSFGTRLARLLANAVYTVRTGPQNDAVLQEIDSQATVIFVMNHRSNMDYVLVTYLAARTSALSYAVGEWARVWPLSRLIKSMGAYFIRRKSRGALYRKVLARYVHMATQGGVAQAIFPEGGLSLNGKQMPPKLGLLNYVVEGHTDDERDVVFVPVAINYDRVLEDKVLMAADARGDRRFGARISVVVGFILRKLWQTLRGRYSRFGVAAVVFGAPLSLKEFGNDCAVEDLARTLMQRVNDAMPVLFVPLVSHVILEHGQPVTDSTLQDLVLDVATKIPPSALLIPAEAIPAAIRQACDKMTARGMIIADHGTWSMADDQKGALAYYANSIRHLISDDAATAK